MVYCYEINCINNNNGFPPACTYTEVRIDKKGKCCHRENREKCEREEKRINKRFIENIKMRNRL